MEVRPGYKQTEVGVLPEDWGVAALGKSCDIVTKGTTPTSIGRAFTKSGVAFLKAEAIAESGSTIPEKIAYIDTITHTLLKRSQLKRNDLLISIAGVLGRVGFVEESDLPANTNQALAIVRLGGNSEFERAYLFYALRSPSVSRQIRDINVQAAQANISLQDVRDFILPSPPLREQRVIATALSDVDALLGGLDRLIAKRRDLKQAAMQQLLTGQTRLPGFHGKWEVKRLGEIAHIKTGSRNNEDKVEDGEYPFFVRSEHVERINSYSHDCEAILVPGEGRIGDIFHYINGRFDVHQRVYAITQFTPGMSAKFAHLYMAMNFGAWAMQNTVKATVDSLRLPTFQTFEVLVPPTKDEQTAIAAVLSDMDAELAALEARRDKTRGLKQAMMQELLTGRTRLV